MDADDPFHRWNVGRTLQHLARPMSETVALDPSVTLADVQAARTRLNGLVLDTPVVPDTRLSERTGANVFLKAECMQRSGAFKVRGAFNRLLTMPDDERRRGVIAQSAGNHAQGVALAARHLGIPAVIVMPEHAPLTKVVATRRLGAEVILSGDTFDACSEKAAEVQAERGLTLVHPFDDPAVIAGQGTLGMELLDVLPEVDLVVVPVGGGGLISGIATAMKALRPSVRIVGVQAERNAATARSFAEGHPVTVSGGRSLADGLAVKKPGRLTLPIIQQLVDDMVTVSEDDIAAGIAHAAMHPKLVTEGAGAAGLAALLAGKIAVAPGQTVATPLCGGNIDANILARVLETVLVRQGHYLLLKLTVEDRPGELAKLVEVIAATGANVVEVLHRRAAWLVPLDRAGLELVLEVKDDAHADTVVATLRDTGYPVATGAAHVWPT